MDVRLRFAPSPTGHLHIGGLRAALFNWLFAKKHNGKFLLRIEDTDLERSTAEYTASILNAFEWTGLKSDEPVVIQSHRVKEHQNLAKKLVSESKAYICKCTSLELQQRLGSNAMLDGYVKYDGFCRDKNHTDDSKQPYVIRFKLPSGKLIIKIDDLVFGLVEFDIEQFDDFILIKSDGFPTYNFAVVADDIFMRITHIVRGQEHLVNTPKQILLYNALNQSLPYFAHLPLILGPDGKKLSKRDAATSVMDYKTEGFLPNALCNYLIRLGWAHGDQEIFSMDDLVKIFSLKDVNKKGAIFDLQKLEWLNGVYLRKLSALEILRLIVDNVDKNFLIKMSHIDQLKLLNLIELYKERSKTLKELKDHISSVLIDPNFDVYNEHLSFFKHDTLSLLESVIHILNAVEVYSVQNISQDIKKFSTESSVELPLIYKSIRIALTGTQNAPGVPDLLYNLGRENSLNRIHNLISYLKIHIK